MITVCLIVVISIVSIICYNNRSFYYLLIFNPKKKNQLHRYISYAFVHSNYIHLIVNVFIFYIFGNVAETFLSEWYLTFIVLSIFVSLLPYLLRNNVIIGLSGCNCSLIFFCIINHPQYFWISSFYLLYCWYSDNNSNDNIAHASHLWGSLFAFFFVCIWKFELLFDIFAK